MPVEIERKFFVADPSWREHADEGVLIRQSYLATNGRASVRVRIRGDGKATLTVKLPGSGLSRLEFEYDIPADEAEVLMRVRQGGLVEKTRYRVTVAGMVWEIDVFSGENDGLVIAEIELEQEDQPFARPAWLGPEVTGDERYHNSRLAQRPFASWSSAPLGQELVQAE